MVFNFFKKKNPVPQEEKLFRSAYYRRLINEDRDKHNEKRIDDLEVMAGNYAFNDVMNAAAVWKNKTNLQEDWNRFELAVIMMFLTRYSKITAVQLGLTDDQIARVTGLMPSELLIGYCSDCPNLSLDTLLEDFKAVDTSAREKFGNTSLDGGYERAFIMSMADLVDGNKTTKGREQLHYFMEQVEECARNARPEQIVQMETNPPEKPFFQNLTDHSDNPKNETHGNDQASKTCPFCAETIKEAAKKCRYCGEWLETKD